MHDRRAATGRTVVRGGSRSASAAAADQSRHVPDDSIRAARLAQVAAELTRAGDPKADELFARAQALLLSRDSVWPGEFARNILTLIFALARAGRIDDAIEAARINFGEDARSRVLEEFTRVLIDEGRLAEAWEFAHATIEPSYRAEALLHVALAVVEKEPAKCQELFDRIREVARADKRPDRKSTALVRLVRLAELRRCDEAVNEVEAIPLHSFRASAFHEIALKLTEDGEHAESSFERAWGEACRIPDSDERRAVVGDLADSTARIRGVRQGLGIIDPADFDDYIRTLIRWKPYLESVDSALPSKALCAAVAIAGWIRPDWKQVDEAIRRAGVRLTE